MKLSTNKLLARSLALPLLALASAHGATLWVDEVLSVPTTHIAADPSDITDQSNSTSWSEISLAENETLTLGWTDPFFNDGTGQIVVNTTLNLFPMSVGSGFDVRFLLTDGSYSSSYTVAASMGVKVLDVASKKYVARQAFNIADVYFGPLAIKGVELTNLNPYDANDGQGVQYKPFNLLSVNAVVPVPEPSSSLVAAFGVILFAGRRRR